MSVRGCHHFFAFRVFRVSSLFSMKNAIHRQQRKYFGGDIFPTEEVIMVLGVIGKNNNIIGAAFGFQTNRGNGGQ